MARPKNKPEKYKFLRLYDMDFNMALQTIKVLKRHKRKDVRYPLLRDVIVAYSRPFTESRGFNIKKDFFSIKFMPSEIEMKKLHEELLVLRKELFAHTDLRYKNPKVVNWSTEAYKWFPMSFKGFDYEVLEKQLSNIKKLIEHAQLQLRREIREYEKDF